MTFSIFNIFTTSSDRDHELFELNGILSFLKILQLIIKRLTFFTRFYAFKILGKNWSVKVTRYNCTVSRNIHFLARHLQMKWFLVFCMFLSIPAVGTAATDTAATLEEFDAYLDKTASQLGGSPFAAVVSKIGEIIYER